MSDVIESRLTNENIKQWSDDSYAREWLKRQVTSSQAVGIFTVSVVLTPELSELLLLNNPNNRNISDNKVLKYAEDIFSGRWQHNGEPIIIAKTGELNDGQHRCRAVILTKKSITTQMTFGVDRSTRSTIDIGIKRSIGQHLQMAGHLDGHHLGHAIALIMGFERRGIIENPNINNRPTTADILEWASKKDITEHIRVGAKVGKMVGVSHGLMAAISYLLHKVDEHDAGIFFDLLCNGTDLAEGNPVLSLRNQLIKRKGQKGFLPWDEYAAIIIKAWNFWRSGKLRVRSISWKSGVGEKFPIPE